MTPIRVVVADDSATVRLWLREVLTPQFGFDLVGEATNGAECVELVAQSHPDVIVMDVDMPEMDGIDATREVMSRTPTPILIFTASTIARDRKVAFEALAAGALDVFHKPTSALEGVENSPDAKELRQLLTLLAPIKVIRRRSARESTPLAEPITAATASRGAGGYRVLAIGASTGGPMAVLTVLKAIPRTTPLCILLVQHQAADFMADFISWLADNVSLPVKSASHGDMLRPGVVFVAPADRHMRLQLDGRLSLDQEPPMHACRPAADALLSSVARASGPKSIGVVLTGIGRDGAAGLLDMRRNGALTVAQDEASSVVYGMPRAAVEIGAAAHELPVDEIGSFVSLRGLAGAAK
jgi:two-component system chemotaxis response regulator CheB